MPENLPAEILALREQAKRLLEEELTSMEPTLGPDTSIPIPPETAEWTRARSREAGLFTLSQPKELGGDDAGALTLTVLRETLAASNLRLARLVLGPDPGVLRHAGGELVESHLQPVLRGEKKGAFAFTEPRDAPHPTSATPQGEDLLVHGTKAYVTGGDEADFFLTLVRVKAEGDSAGGTAMLVIDKDTPGVHVHERFQSLDGSHHVSLHFHDARVPRARIIGEVGEGMPRALRNIGSVRLALSAQASGMCLFVLEQTAQSLQLPHRSGTPLAERESVRLRYADMRIEATAARSLLYRTARLADTGANTVNETIATKVFTTEVLGRVVDMAMQLEGGQALVAGHPLETLYRRARAMRLTEGANDLLRLQLARGKLELGKGTI